MPELSIDLSELESREAHDLLSSAIIPRPIAWVTSVDTQGKVNCAPFSFFSGVTWSPPTLLVSVVNRKDGDRKDTIRNIESTGEFIVNLVCEAMGEAMVQSASIEQYGVDEAEALGIQLIPSEIVSVPRIEGAIAFECRQDHIIRVGEGPNGANLVLGRIERMHIQEDLLKTSRCVDWEKARLIGRLSGTRFCRLGSVFDIDPRKQVGWK